MTHITVRRDTTITPPMWLVECAGEHCRRIEFSRHATAAAYATKHADSCQVVRLLRDLDRCRQLSNQLIAEAVDGPATPAEPATPWWPTTPGTILLDVHTRDGRHYPQALCTGYRDAPWRAETLDGGVRWLEDQDILRALHAVAVPAHPITS